MSTLDLPLNIVTPFALEGSAVRLEPIRPEHAESFWEAAKDALDDIFQWIPYQMKTREDFQRLVEKAFAEQERGESIVFATVERNSGKVIGSTRFMNIDRINRRVEIGSTWIARHGSAPPSIPKPNISCCAMPSKSGNAFVSNSKPTHSIKGRAMRFCASARKKKAHCAGI